VKILIIDNTPLENPLWNLEFVKPIEDIVKKDSDFYTIHYTKIKTLSLEKYEKIILSGSPLNDFKFLEKINDYKVLLNTDKFILGICAGAQIITKLLNSNLINSEEIGLIKLKKIKEDPILKDVNLDTAYSLHKKCFRKIYGFEILLENNIPQLMKSKKIYLCLFHPEVRNKQLIRNFINL
jgi:GMP synthase-like glutamine amidotransferase